MFKYIVGLICQQVRSRRELTMIHWTSALSVLCMIVLTANGHHICSEHFGLRPVCGRPGTQTAFLCLINSNDDVFWGYKPDKDTKTIHIARSRTVVPDLTEKYTSVILYENNTHSCAQLLIKVEDADIDKTYYQCKFAEDEYWAQLRITELHSGNLEASLSLVEHVGANSDGQGMNIIITATVTGFSGIPGLQLKLYVNDKLVKKEPPGSLECMIANHVNLTHTEHFDDGHPAVLGISLSYIHASLSEEKVLTRDVHIIHHHKTDIVKGSLQIDEPSGMLLIKANIPNMDDIFGHHLNLYANSRLIKEYTCESACNMEEMLELYDEPNLHDDLHCIKLLLTYSSDSVTNEHPLDIIMFSTPNTRTCSIGKERAVWIGVVILLLVVLVCLVLICLRKQKLLRNRYLTKDIAGDKKLSKKQLDTPLLNKKQQKSDVHSRKTRPKLTKLADMLKSDRSKLAEKLHVSENENENYDTMKTLFVLHTWQEENNDKSVTDQDFIDVISALERDDVVQYITDRK